MTEMTKENFHKKPKHLLEFFAVSIIVGLALLLIGFHSFYFTASVKGHSMDPSIKNGDRVLCDKFQMWDSWESIEEGEVIVNKDLVIHRIEFIYPEENKIITMGDNNTESDPPITIKDVHAVNCRILDFEELI